MSAVQFAVGKYTCRVTLPEIRRGTVSHVTVEWDPCMPGRLTDAERRQYESGLALALSSIAGKPVPTSTHRENPKP